MTVQAENNLLNHRALQEMLSKTDVLDQLQESLTLIQQRMENQFKTNPVLKALQASLKANNLKNVAFRVTSDSATYYWGAPWVQEDVYNGFSLSMNHQKIEKMTSSEFLACLVEADKVFADAPIYNHTASVIIGVDEIQVDLGIERREGVYSSEFLSAVVRMCNS